MLVYKLYVDPQFYLYFKVRNTSLDLLCQASEKTYSGPSAVQALHACGRSQGQSSRES